MKMEAKHYSDTSLKVYRTSRYYVPENDTVHNHSCKNFKLKNIKVSYDAWVTNMVRESELQKN
jgi:hypothetical protein